MTSRISSSLADRLIRIAHKDHETVIATLESVTVKEHIGRTPDGFQYKRVELIDGSTIVVERCVDEYRFYNEEEFNNEIQLELRLKEWEAKHPDPRESDPRYESADFEYDYDYC